MHSSSISKSFPVKVHHFSDNLCPGGLSVLYKKHLALVRLFSKYLERIGLDRIHLHLALAQEITINNKVNTLLAKIFLKNGYYPLHSRILKSVLFINSRLLST